MIYAIGEPLVALEVFPKPTSLTVRAVSAKVSGKSERAYVIRFFAETAEKAKEEITPGTKFTFHGIVVGAKEDEPMYLFAQNYSIG